ncbi:MAG: hypothetical protein SNH27_11900 [Rikenellaceae bacterium]
MVGQEDGSVSHPTLVGVIMCLTVIEIVELLATAIGGSSHSGFTFPSADDFDGAMKNGHGMHLLFQDSEPEAVSLVTTIQPPQALLVARP